MSDPKTVIEDDAEVLFERWYVVPLRELEKIPNGDGGFVVLAICCFLYERYAKALLDSQGLKASDENLIGQFPKDFNTDDETAASFWNVIRNGFLHQGMGKQKEHGKQSLPAWETSAAFKDPVRLDKSQKNEVLQIQPWLFKDMVLELYASRPDLIAHNQSFPWASISKG